jgi:hypothetical protein
MRNTNYPRLIARVILVYSLIAIAGVRVSSQERESARADLSGRWQINRELSENAQQKIDRIQSSQGHGPGRHGLGGIFGRLFGGGDMQEARRMLLDAPTSFTLAQDGNRIVLTGSDGRVRMLTANGQKEKLNGRDLLTKWDGPRLVSETTIGDVRVTDTFEHSATARQLIVTTRMDMREHGVSVRRVYDAERPR